MDIANILNKEPGNYLKDILCDLENKIVNLEVENDYDSLCKYIKDNY